MRPERFQRSWEQQRAWEATYVTPTKPVRKRSWQEQGARLATAIALGFLTLAAFAAWDGQVLFAISSALHVVVVALVGLILARFA